MVDMADMVITTSSVLQGHMENQFPQKPNDLIPNGCDLEHFKRGAKMQKPKEFANHKGPIITYCGAWAKWIDRPLVEKIAEAFPDALVAIIGVEFGTSVGNKIPNLRYLGYKSYHDLPAYLCHSTVCIIPFLIEEITVATNPIKMYEYLASGKPVVSTDIPEARLAPSVYVGEDHEKFIKNIRLILGKKVGFDKDKVESWLSERTWERRFDTIFDALNKNPAFIKLSK
jgi:glycosyltransferase involved in cell wall biosynthesis